MATYQINKTGAQIEQALDDATRVVANPSTEASTDLTRLTVGNTTYNIPSGSEGSNKLYMHSISLKNYTSTPPKMYISVNIINSDSNAFTKATFLDYINKNYINSAHALSCAGVARSSGDITATDIVFGICKAYESSTTCLGVAHYATCPNYNLGNVSFLDNVVEIK